MTLDELGIAFAGGCRVRAWRGAGWIEKLRGELAARYTPSRPSTG